MFRTAAGIPFAAVAAFLLCPAWGQGQERVDPGRKAGVYAEAGGQAIELTAFAEVRETGSTPADTWGTPGAGRAAPAPDPMRVAKGQSGRGAIPYLPDVSAFLINLQGPYADSAVERTAMVFSVGDNVPGGPQPIDHGMTCKVLKTGVTLWRVTSSELDRRWLQKTYEQDTAKLGQENARAYITILIRDNTGKPPQLYVVQVFPAEVSQQ